MSEWKEVKLGDLVTIKYGKDHKSLSDGVFPVFGSGGLMRKVDSYIYDKPSLLIPRKGTLNNIIYTEERFWTVDTMFWTKVDELQTSAKFLYYYLKNFNFNALNVGSAVPSLTVPVLNDIDIKLPSTDKQSDIVGILSSLDAKIETNNKLNEKLEEMAQAIFKSWFMDFEPFKDKPFHETELGMIPEGWEVVSLCDIANFTNGLAMQKYRPNDDEAYLPVLKIKELRQGFCDDTSEICTNDISEDYIAEDGDIIFSWSGTLLVDIWCGGECGVNQHLFKVTSEKYNKWFYYYWIKKHLEEFIRIAKDKAVTMGHIKREHLRNALVVVPDNKTMHNADKIFSPIINRIIESRIESKRLASLRDTLLPRLMSGEIKI